VAEVKELIQIWGLNKDKEGIQNEAIPQTKTNKRPIIILTARKSKSDIIKKSNNSKFRK
jgi:hypothetical protein